MRLRSVATDKEFVFRRVILVSLPILLVAPAASGIWALRPTWVFLAIFWAYLIMFNVVWWRMQIRSARLLKSRHYAICPQCRYLLQPDSEIHTCPECGSTYSNEELVKIWKRLYDWRLRR